MDACRPALYHGWLTGPFWSAGRWKAWLSPLLALLWGGGLAPAADSLPRVPPTEPPDAAATLMVRPGFRLDLVAAEPLVASPVALTVDEAGRAYVLEMRDYSERRPERLGRVRRLTDTNHDGRFDTATVFVSDLPWPTAIMSWDGGVFIGATPDIIYAKDTDGDGVADVREVVFTGFASDYAPFATNRLNVQALLNSFQWAPDCRIHGAGSLSGGKVQWVDSEFTRAWRKKAGAGPARAVGPVELRGQDFSFDPRSLDFRVETGGGQHGMSFDHLGRKFVCSNSDHLQQVVFDEGSAPENRFHDLPPARRSIAADGPAAEVFRRSPEEPWRVLRTRWRVSGVTPGIVEGGGRASGYFTGATGVTLYRGDAWGPELVGDAFIADCGSNLIHRKKLRLGPDGVLLVGERAPDEQQSEFVASTDNWFRPVQFYNGPDGCLWVIDMYREFIEHPWSLPGPIKVQLDLDSGRERGRIWRMGPDSVEREAARWSLDDLSVSNLVATLAHPNGWHRDTAARLLYQRSDAVVVEAVQTQAREWRGGFSSGPGAVPGRIQVLGWLEAAGALEDPVLERAFRDSDGAVRRQAYHYAGRRAGVSKRVAEGLIQRAAEETEAAAAFELALALAEVPVESRIPALAIMARSPSPWVQSAALHAVGTAAPELWRVLVPDSAQPTAPRPVLVALAQSLGRSGNTAAVERALEQGARLQPRAQAFEVVAALADGVRQSGGSLRTFDSSGALASLLAQAAETLNEPSGATPGAVRLAALLPMEQALPLLLPQETPMPPDLREAVWSALGQLQGDDWTRLMSRKLKEIPSEMRSPMLALLLRRPEGAIAILQQVESGELDLGQLDPASVTALRRHGNTTVRERASRVLGEPAESRQAVVESFIGALDLPGDAAKGQRVFQERCSSCHAWKGEGVTLGPDLASVAANGREKLLVAILDPNREVAPNFSAWTAETTDGESVSGILASRTPTTVLLRQAGGGELTLATDRVRALRPEGRSLMPEGLEEGLDRESLADLLAFLTNP